MDLLSAFAVGLRDGARSATYALGLDADRSAVLLRAATRMWRSELTIALPAPGASPGEDRPVARDDLRPAVSQGDFVPARATLGPWPGVEVAPGVSRLLALHLVESALRPFDPAPDMPEPVWIPPPPTFGEVVVEVLLCAPTTSWPGSSARRTLGEGLLRDARSVRVTWRADATSRLQRAGLFTALRRRPPDLSQEVLVAIGARLLFACAVRGGGLLVEVAGDMFMTAGTC